MPITKAAVKHLRKSLKQRKINRVLRDKVKDTYKGLVKLAKQNKFDEFKKKLPQAASIIDKAVKQHILQKNNAARKKSRLAHLLAASAK